MSIEKLRGHLHKQDRLHHRATKTAFHNEARLAYPELSAALRALLHEHEEAGIGASPVDGNSEAWDIAEEAIKRYGESE